MVLENLSQSVSSNGVRWCSMEYKCDLRKEDKSVQKNAFWVEIEEQDGVLVHKQNPAFWPKMLWPRTLLLWNNLCMILPRILNSISKQRSQDPTSIYLRDNDQKNTLMLSKVHARNEILKQVLIIQLKVHNGLHFNHTPGPPLPEWHFVHTWCFLFRKPPSSVLNAFLFDKTFCLVIITYLWSQFRNLTFSFWFVIYSFVCFLVIECHLLSCQSQTLIFVQFARKKQWNRNSLSDLDYFLTFVQWRRCAKIFLYRN